MLFWSVGVLLTNAYKVYLRVTEDEGVTKKSEGLMSHYEFRKSIALYWINPELMEEKVNVTLNACSEVASALQSPSTASSLTSTSVESFATTPSTFHLTDLSLKDSSRLQCRLDRTMARIPMIAASKKVKCAMHRWLGARKEGQLLYCPQCKVNLCSGCYYEFHYHSDLVGSKAKLIYNLKSRNDYSIDNSRSKKRKKK